MLKPIDYSPTPKDRALTDDTEDSLDTDQWANTIGEDAELDRLWAMLMQATAPVEPRALESRLAQHLAGLGARSRRTTEGLILAAIAATAAEGPGWEGLNRPGFVGGCFV